MKGSLRAGRPGFAVARATPADDAELRRLLRDAPMDGAIRISLEREPDTGHAAAVEGDRHDTIVVRDAGTGELIGMGSRVVREVWLEGDRARVGYLGQLRVAHGRRGWRRLVAAFEAMERLRRPGELPFDLSAIIADNVAGRRLFERGLPGLPVFRSLGEYVTLLIPARRRRRLRRAPELVRSASSGDLPAIAECLQRNLRRYQLAPVWTEESLRSPERTRGLDPEDFHIVTAGDRVVACAARWDQRGFKQAVVRGYAPALAYWRPLLNVALTLGGRPRLPSPGTPLGLVYLSHLAFDPDRGDLVWPLVDAALERVSETDVDYLVVGLAAVHPLLPELLRRFRGRTYRSVVYQACWPGAGSPRPELDARTLHLEVATF